MNQQCVMNLIFKNTLHVALPWFPPLFLKRRQAAEIGRCRVWTRYFLSQWLQLKFLHEEWCPSFQAVRAALEGGCSCTSTVWRAVWVLKLCLPPGLALQAGITSLLPPLWTGISEIASSAWVAPPRRMEVIWASPGPMWGWQGLCSGSCWLLWWRQSWGCVQPKVTIPNRHIITALCWVASWQEWAWFSCSVSNDGWL